MCVHEYYFIDSICQYHNQQQGTVQCYQCMTETRISQYQDVLVRVKSETIPKSHCDIMENRIPQI